MRYKQLRDYAGKTTPIDIMYMFGEFGTLEIDLTHERNTTTKTFDCVFVLGRTRSVTSQKFWIKIFNIKQEEVCRLHQCSKC